MIFMKQAILLLLIFCFFSSTIFAVDSTTVQKYYYENYKHTLILRTYLISKYNQITFDDKSTNTKLIYKPNDHTNLGFGFNYKGIGLNAAFDLLGNQNSDEKYGKTKSVDIQSNIYGKKIGIDAAYQNYRGYYFSNVSDVDPLFKPSHQNYPQRPDIRTRSVSISSFYNFNSERFSYRSTYTQNERQLKSAGAPILGFYCSLLDIQSMSDSAFLLPSSYILSYHPDFWVEAVKSINFGSLAGYGYTLVIAKRIFLTVNAGIGIGYESTLGQYRYKDDRKYRQPSSAGFLRTGVGYNSKKLYVGFTSIGSNFSSKRAANGSINYNSGSFRLIFAYRFTSPKFLDKLFDKSNN